MFQVLIFPCGKKNKSKNIFKLQDTLDLRMPRDAQKDHSLLVHIVYLFNRGCTVVNLVDLLVRFCSIFFIGSIVIVS